MKTKLLILIAIMALLIVSFGAKEILKRRYYDTRLPILLPQLTESEIASIANKDTLDQFMVGITITGQCHFFYCYIFDDLSTILSESVSSTIIKDQLADQRAKGENIKIEPSIVKQIDECPYGEYTNYYRIKLPKEVVIQLIKVLLDAKRHMPGDPAKEPSMKGIYFSLALHLGDKAAVYTGEAYTGDSEYDQNEGLLRFELNILIPYIKDNGALVEQDEFKNILIDNLEGYPFAKVWEEGQN